MPSLFLEMAEVIECLLSKHKALNSNPSAPKKERKKLTLEGIAEVKCSQRSSTVILSIQQQNNAPVMGTECRFTLS
jgi:hypothetical protein